jgi:hypothetical protein
MFFISKCASLVRNCAQNRASVNAPLLRIFESKVQPIKFATQKYNPLSWHFKSTNHVVLDLKVQTMEP